MRHHNDGADVLHSRDSVTLEFVQRAKRRLETTNLRAYGESFPVARLEDFQDGFGRRKAGEAGLSRFAFAVSEHTVSISVDTVKSSTRGVASGMQRLHDN